MCSDFYLDDKTSKKLDKKVQDFISRIGVDRKTLDEVFDKSTLKGIEKLISNRVLDIIDFPISTGKEGAVFRGITPDKKIVAIKIYRTSNATFKHIKKYISGDPRFSGLNKNRRDLIYQWTKKEFKNLERLEKIGVKSPKPICKINNILVMEYIGEKTKVAPMLKNVTLKKPKTTYLSLINAMKKMYKEAKLVHGDLSPYNILIYKGKPIIIDIGQGVLLEHPLAEKFLIRDIHNICIYFKKYDIISDEKKIFKTITDRNI
jgi:RIO kinase 1